MSFAFHLRKASLFVGAMTLASFCTPVCWARSVVQAAYYSAGTSITLPDDNALTRTSYKEDQGDLHATMEIQSVSATQRIVISVRRSDSRLATLDEQAGLIDLLLQRVRHDYSNISDFDVMFGSGREAFLAPLNDYLVQSPEWNSRTGRPRHGQLGPFLTETINSRGVLTPLQKAFEHNGFLLSPRRSRQDRC